MSIDPIVCRALHHSYGKKEVLHGLDFTVEPGGIVGLLGKNGAGKSTTINILMGFLRPDSGECSVLGHPSHAIPPAERRRIGLLHEGFVQYNFMTIEEIERFYAPFYPRWDRSVYYDLVDRLDVPYSRRITRLSCGQRSQVTLGLILAQMAELVILDDYSLGLDVGYRRLFMEFLRDYVDRTHCNVLLTSHVVQELDSFLDKVIIIDKVRLAAMESKDSFMSSFFRYDLPAEDAVLALRSGEGPILRAERGSHSVSLFSRADVRTMAAYLAERSIAVPEGFSHIPMNFEDAFVGLTGRY